MRKVVLLFFLLVLPVTVFSQVRTGTGPSDLQDSKYILEIISALNANIEKCDSSIPPFKNLIEFKLAYILRMSLEEFIPLNSDSVLYCEFDRPAEKVPKEFKCLFNDRFKKALHAFTSRPEFFEEIDTHCSIHRVDYESCHFRGRLGTTEFLKQLDKLLNTHEEK